MIICLDTNVLVQARAKGHVFFPILDAWVAGRFTLAVSTPILLEYEEVIARPFLKSLFVYRRGEMVLRPQRGQR